MGRTIFLCAATFWLIILYAAICYYQINLDVLIDYSSYYAAAKALVNDITPYQVLTTTVLEGAKKLPANLNPPCVLWLFQPFTYIPFKLGLMIWDILSVLAGVQAARITFRYFGKDLFTTPYQYWLLYFSLFPIIINFTIAQVGSFITFFVLQGYDHLQRNNPIRAGLYWGSISAMKLFPLLLLIYAFLRKEYRVCLFFSCTFVALSFLPLLQTDISVYHSYYSLIKKVFWYGDNWNASLYGYLFRLFIDCNNKQQYIAWIEIFYLCILIICLIAYIRLYYKKTLVKNNPESEFSFTVTLMLFLSPLGWLYYFQLLLPQALVIYRDIKTHTSRAFRLILNMSSLILLLFPSLYARAASITNLMDAITYYSFYFYGMLLMLLHYFLPSEPEKADTISPIHSLNRLISLLIFLGTCLLYYYLLKMVYKF